MHRYYRAAMMAIAVLCGLHMVFKGRIFLILALTMLVISAGFRLVSSRFTRAGVIDTEDNNI